MRTRFGVILMQIVHFLDDFATLGAWMAGGCAAGGFAAGGFAAGASVAGGPVDQAASRLVSCSLAAGGFAAGGFPKGALSLAGPPPGGGVVSYQNWGCVTILAQTTSRGKAIPVLNQQSN